MPPIQNLSPSLSLFLGLSLLSSEPDAISETRGLRQHQFVDPYSELRRWSSPLTEMPLVPCNGWGG